MGLRVGLRATFEDGGPDGLTCYFVFVWYAAPCSTDTPTGGGPIPQPIPRGPLCDTLPTHPLVERLPLLLQPLHLPLLELLLPLQPPLERKERKGTERKGREGKRTEGKETKGKERSGKEGK